MELKSKIFFRITFVLAILCLIMMFIVDRGSAEFVILAIAGMLNCICSIIGIITALRRKKDK